MVILRIQGLTLTNGNNVGHLVLSIAVYEVKPEVELDTITEPRRNPFGNNQIMTGESRKIDQLGKTQRERNSNRI